MTLPMYRAALTNYSSMGADGCYLETQARHCSRRGQRCRF
jgi:hypothetical protein